MRYCSIECVAAYQRRLAEATVGKIRILESRLGDSRVRAEESKKKLHEVIFNDRVAF
jgi:hypothetical protein